MRDGDGDGAGARVHPRLVAQHVIAVQADAPALVRLLDPPPESVGHDLMAEADADQPSPPPRGAEPVDHLRYPRQVVIDPRRRAGDDDACECGWIVRQTRGLNIEPPRRHALAQQGPEPGWIVVERIL